MFTNIVDNSTRIKDALGPFVPLMKKAGEAILMGIQIVMLNLNEALKFAADYLETHQNQVKGIAELFKGIVEMVFGATGQGWKDLQKGLKDFNTPDGPHAIG